MSDQIWSWGSCQQIIIRVKSFLFLSVQHEGHNEGEQSNEIVGDEGMT